MNATHPTQPSSANPAGGLNVPLVTTDDFSSQVTVAGNGVILKLKGTADIRVMFPLESMISALEAEIERAGLREVVVDLRELEFMNSSCFKSFVTWLSHVQECEPERQYPIRFLSDPQKHWQARSLNALSCFAVNLVRIES